MMRSSFLRALCVAITGCASPLFVESAELVEPFDYFSNSWNVIGLKDYIDGTRITPSNELLLAEKRRLRLRFGRELTPLSRKQTKTLLDGWLPIVLLSATDVDVRYDVAFWATPLPTVKDWRKAYDWPTEGENFLNWILVTATNAGASPATAKLTVERINPGKSAPTAAKPHQSFIRQLEAGARAEFVIREPFAPIEDVSAFAQEDPKVWLDRTTRYWRDLMAKAARIEVPCRKATQALLAAHVCQLIANDHGQLQGGEGFYDEFYIRDGGYQIMELEEAGLFDAAQKAVAFYLSSQRPDGRFETQKGQFDANGQAVWVLWQYYKITGDRNWLTKVYPQMRRAVDWTTRARREAPADSPFAGVLPNALADGECLWGGKHHIVGYDLWNLRGMLCTADAAGIFGKVDEANELRTEADGYRAAIDAVWKRTGVPHFPPSWEKAGTHWGNTETLWPTEIFRPDDPRVAATIAHARKEHGGGFIEGTIQWLGKGDVEAIHPYMSAYTTMASLARGEHEQVVEDFYWYLLHSAATHAFPEGIYYKRRFAWSDTVPHVTGASNYALMLRHLLIHERGEELHLLSAVPDWWLSDRKEIRVQRAPTHFGEMGLHVRGMAKGVRVTLTLSRRQPPKRIVLHLPKARPLVEDLAGVEVAVRPDQTTRWDFASVIERYRAVAPKSTRPIHGLVALPLASALVPDQCRMLDLTPHANTDPFTAPFGVRKPGKLLFTGLPVGVETVGGIPFRIIDPAKNAGRGLVVLHSPSAPTDRAWPREITIPINAKGKRVFFLGNVTGWGSSDPGTGDWGAVAVYEIHYADGGIQTVPWITGRTTEDWLVRDQEAMDVLRGMEGDPWHLNVIGVRLRDAAVQKIVFRDLGTVAAPLLAAITMET